MATFIRRVSRFSVRQSIALAMVFLLTAALVPAPATAAVLQMTEKTAREGGNQVWNWLGSALDVLRKADGVDRERKGIRPASPLTKAEREARVTNLELNVPNEIELKSQQRSLLSAIPLDAAGKYPPRSQRRVEVNQ